uniref:AT5g26290/F9D12_6 n=1 Tax=Arabidopsis thaliana TaxID=3702 RepID=Q94BY5_ARATH|nr:AT5g26290/F9D12_6 [Arabidopsis thaliana]
MRQKSWVTDNLFLNQHSTTGTMGTVSRTLVHLVLRSTSLNQPNKKRKSHSYQTLQTMFSLGRYFISLPWKIKSISLTSFLLETDTGN